MCHVPSRQSYKETWRVKYMIIRVEIFQRRRFHSYHQSYPDLLRNQWEWKKFRMKSGGRGWGLVIARGQLWWWSFSPLSRSSFFLTFANGNMGAATSSVRRSGSEWFKGLTAVARRIALQMPHYGECNWARSPGVVLQSRNLIYVEVMCSMGSSQLMTESGRNTKQAHTWKTKWHLWWAALVWEHFLWQPCQTPLDCRAHWNTGTNLLILPFIESDLHMVLFHLSFILFYITDISSKKSLNIYFVICFLRTLVTSYMLLSLCFMDEPQVLA